MLLSDVRCLGNPPLQFRSAMARASRKLPYLQKAENNLPADVVLVYSEERGIEKFIGAAGYVIFGLYVLSCIRPR